MGWALTLSDVPLPWDLERRLEYRPLGGAARNRIFPKLHFRGIGPYDSNANRGREDSGHAVLTKSVRYVTGSRDLFATAKRQEVV